MRYTFPLPIAIAVLLLFPTGLRAGGQQADSNVNSRYTVESTEISGVDESKVSKDLRQEMQKLVGEKYSQDSAAALAKRMRNELPYYEITTKVKRGDTPDHVKVVFEAERIRWKWFEFTLPPLVYESKEGWSGGLDIPIRTHDNTFAFGLVDTSDELLERFAGIRAHYENERVGTRKVQLRIAFDSYHEKWNPTTEHALTLAPQVPGIYRSRQDLAPSVSVLPMRDLKFTVGASFQQLQVQYPFRHTEAAYAGTADIQYRRDFEPDRGYGHHLRTEYGLRTATRVLDSDFVYTRHFWSLDYTAANRRNAFGAHFQAGAISGLAPLFERFSLGNSFTLRGWNKFDVAPLGGNRLAYGSFEYRYRPLQVFYDVGTVWDGHQPATVHHALGLGLAFKGGAFVSLGFPVRVSRVAPIIMFGFRR